MERSVHPIHSLHSFCECQLMPLPISPSITLKEVHRPNIPLSWLHLRLGLLRPEVEKEKPREQQREWRVIRHALVVKTSFLSFVFLRAFARKGHVFKNKFRRNEWSYFPNSSEIYCEASFFCYIYFQLWYIFEKSGFVFRMLKQMKQKRKSMSWKVRNFAPEKVSKA